MTTDTRPKKAAGAPAETLVSRDGLAVPQPTTLTLTSDEGPCPQQQQLELGQYDPAYPPDHYGPGPCPYNAFPAGY